MNKINNLSVGDVYQSSKPNDGKHYLVTGVVCLKGETYIQSVSINITGNSDFNLPFFQTEIMLVDHFNFLFTLDMLIEQNQIKLDSALKQLDLHNNKYRVMRYSWKDVSAARQISTYRKQLFYFEQLRAIYSGDLQSNVETQFLEYQSFKDKVNAFGTQVHKKVREEILQVCPNILCLDSITPLAQVDSTDMNSLISNYFWHIPETLDFRRYSLVLAYRSVEGFPDLAEFYLVLGCNGDIISEYLTFKGAKPQFATELQLNSQRGRLKALMPLRMNGKAFLSQDWLSMLLESIGTYHSEMKMVESICKKPKPVLPHLDNMKYIFFDLASRLALSEIRFDTSQLQEYQLLFDAILHGESVQTDFILQYINGSLVLPWKSLNDSSHHTTKLNLVEFGLDEDLLVCDFKLFDLNSDDDVYTKLRDWSVLYLSEFGTECLAYPKEYKLALEYKANLKSNHDFVTKSIIQHLSEHLPELNGLKQSELVVQTIAILDKQFPLKPFALPQDNYTSTPEWNTLKQVVDSLLGDSQIPDKIMDKIREQEKLLIRSYNLEAIVYGNIGVSAYFSIINPDDRMEPYAWLKEFTVKYESLVTCFKEVNCAVQLQFVRFAYLRNNPNNILGRQQSRFFISSTDKYLTLQYVKPARINAVLNIFQDMDQERLDRLHEIFEQNADALLNNNVMCDISWFVPYAVIEHGGELYYAGYYNKHFASMIGQYKDKLNIHEDKLLNTLDGIYGIRLSSSMDEESIQTHLKSIIGDKSDLTVYALINQKDFIPLMSQEFQANILLIPQSVNVIEVDYDFFFLDRHNAVLKPGYYATELPKLLEGQPFIRAAR